MAIELVEVDVPEAAGLVDVPADFERVGFANSGGLVFVDESAEEVAMFRPAAAFSGVGLRPSGGRRRSAR